VPKFAEKTVVHPLILLEVYRQYNNSMLRAVLFDCTGVLVERGAVNHRLLDYIRQYLKARFKIGLLSNLSAAYINRLFSPADLLLFDELSLASETGVAKPDPQAYQLAAQKLGVKPEECIFVDDFVERCEAAREQGMQAVLYDSFEQATRGLDTIVQEA
jgi:epoxide hydrolase-like predicted phosphatase